MVPVIASITPDYVVAGGSQFLFAVRGTNFTGDSDIVFGGEVLLDGNGNHATVYVDNTYLYAYVLPSYFATFSLGGATIYIDDPNNGPSNSVIFTIDQQGLISLADIQSMVNAIQIPNASQFTATTTDPYSMTINNMQVYQIKPFDNLQGIAAQMTGDASNWEVIADMNKLTYPYISSDQNVLMGQTNFNVYLTQKAKAGTSTIYINGLSQLLSIGSTLYFNLTSPLTNGQSQVLSDLVTVDSVTGDNTQSIVVLSSPLQNTYESGFVVNVLSAAINITSRVVSPGSYILIPSNSSSQSNIQNNNYNANSLYDILGEDIALDAYGQLWADTNGDLLSFSGMMNLNQALAHRLTTETSSLHYHPEYGDRLLDYVGSIDNDSLLVFAAYEINRTLSQDPRVSSVTNVNVNLYADTLRVSASANIDLLNISQNFNFVIPAV
jgi:hypothetical protein